MIFGVGIRANPAPHLDALNARFLLSPIDHDYDT